MTTVPFAPPRPRGIARVIAGISTLNLLQFAVIGWLSIPVNIVAYYVVNGERPPNDGFERSTGANFWRDYFLFDLPWQYLAITGLVYLLVVLAVTVWPALQFTPTRKGWEFWRTTPAVFRVALGLIFAVSSFGVARYYGSIDSILDPYALGTLFALVGTLVSVGAHLWNKREKPRRKARSRG